MHAQRDVGQPSGATSGQAGRPDRQLRVRPVAGLTGECPAADLTMGAADVRFTMEHKSESRCSGRTVRPAGRMRTRRQWFGLFVVGRHARPGRSGPDLDPESVVRPVVVDLSSRFRDTRCRHRHRCPVGDPGSVRHHRNRLGERLRRSFGRGDGDLRGRRDPPRRGTGGFRPGSLSFPPDYRSATTRSPPTSSPTTPRCSPPQAPPPLSPPPRAVRRSPRPPVRTPSATATRRPSRSPSRRPVRPPAPT